MSHAMALKVGIGAHGLWSISRGLARGLESRTEYKEKMDAADAPREGDVDGRGNLSLRRLRDFVVWFLRVCLDQVRFMASMFELGEVRGRIRRYVESESLPEAAAALLEGVGEAEASVEPAVARQHRDQLRSDVWAPQAAASRPRRWRPLVAAG